jgi:hypothetical protein
MKSVRMGAKAPHSGSEPWHRIADPRHVTRISLHGYRDDFSYNVECCHFSPNGIVQYVYPALSTTIDIGTSDIPLGTLIVHDTM